MGMLRLPFVAELGNRALLAVRREDRIETEAFAPVRLAGDSPFERAGAAVLVALRRDRDELADIPRAPPVAGDALELAQQPADLVTGRASGRLHARPAAEPFHLDAGVLAEHPRVGRPDAAAEDGLHTRVVVVSRAVLGGEVVRIEQLDPPARQ